jgi:dTDP-4-amino-4,6-dideoxy-D-galactose acyltransferase
MAGKKRIIKDFTQSTIKYLDWDSLFFKLKIGKVDVDLASEDIFVYILDQKRNSDYDLIYLTADMVDKAANCWLDENGIVPMNIKITFHKTILDPTRDNPLKIEKYSGITSSKLIQLAFESGHKSRFRKDERLNFRFKDMYQTWIEKSVNGELADVVLISNDNNEISGFVTIKKNIKRGIIGLIAVDQHLRGRGIGRGLLMAAENWCSSEGCDELIVATQLENSEACNLYLRNGYTRLSSQYIFHI